MRSLVINTAFISLGILLALGFSEGAFRLYNHYTLKSPHDDLRAALELSASTDINEIGDSTSLRGIVQAASSLDLVFELKPGMRGRFLGRGLETNSFGMRGPEVSIEKSQGIFRIVGVGDSVMFGWGVEQNESYLSLVENSLRDKGLNVEALNFAVPGYNAAMKVAAFLEKAIHFEPDLLIFHFVNNDLDVPYFMLESRESTSLFGSQLLGEIRVQLGNSLNRETGLLDIPTRRGKDGWEDVLEQFRHMAGPNAFRRNFRELARLCKEKEIPLIFLTGSHTDLTREDIANRMAERFSFDVVEALPTVDAYFSKNFPDADRNFRREMLWVSPQDSHPNELGHRLYAEALLPVLRKHIPAP